MRLLRYIILAYLLFVSLIACAQITEHPCDDIDWSSDNFSGLYVCFDVTPDSAIDWIKPDVMGYEQWEWTIWRTDGPGIIARYTDFEPCHLFNYYDIIYRVGLCVQLDGDQFDPQQLDCGRCIGKYVYLTPTGVVEDTTTREMEITAQYIPKGVHWIKYNMILQKISTGYGHDWDYEPGRHVYYLEELDMFVR